MQVQISDTTADRISAITGKSFSRGADKLFGEVLNIAEGRDPDDNEPRVIECAGLKEALENGQE